MLLRPCFRAEQDVFSLLRTLASLVLALSLLYFCDFLIFVLTVLISHTHTSLKRILPVQLISIKMSVDMCSIQTGKSSDFMAIYFAVSRDWLHGVEAKPLASFVFWSPFSLLLVNLGPCVSPVHIRLPSVHRCRFSQPWLPPATVSLRRVQDLTTSGHLW